MGHLCENLASLGAPDSPIGLVLGLWRPLTADSAEYYQAFGSLRCFLVVCSGFGVTADVHADAFFWTSCRLKGYYCTAEEVTMPDRKSVV